MHAGNKSLPREWRKIEKSTARGSSVDATKQRLIDIISQDPNRVPSLYAQIYGGLLQSVEKSSSEQNSSTESKAAGFAGLFKVDASKSKFEQLATAYKENRTPHDMVALNLLNAIEHRQVPDVFSGVPNSTIVKTKGRLTFFDPGIIAGMGTLAAINAKNQEAKRNAQIMNAISGLRIPTLYYVTHDDGSVVCGTILASGLSEEAHSFLVKLGDDSLPDVHFIGIKEMPASFADAGNTLPFLLGVLRSGYRVTRDMFVHEYAHMAAPILIYRELGYAAG